MSSVPDINEQIRDYIYSAYTIGHVCAENKISSQFFSTWRTVVDMYRTAFAVGYYPLLIHLSDGKNVHILGFTTFDEMLNHCFFTKPEEDVSKYIFTLENADQNRRVMQKTLEKEIKACKGLQVDDFGALMERAWKWAQEMRKTA